MKCNCCGSEMNIAHDNQGDIANDIVWCSDCGSIIKDGKMTIPKKQEKKCSCWKCMGLEKDPYAEDEPKECSSEKVKRLMDFVSDDEGLTYEEVVGELEMAGINVKKFQKRVRKTVKEGIERNFDVVRKADKRSCGKKMMDKHRQNLIDVLQESPRNWTEDFQHENGLYMCKCIKCREYFYGHKRRVVCKVCQIKMESE